MFYHLHNAAPLQVTTCLPANDQIFRVGKARLGADPKDARAKRALRRVMSKEVLCFGWGVVRLKTALHHQKDIHVTWVGLSSDITAEDNKPLQRTCTMHQLIDTF